MPDDRLTYSDLPRVFVIIFPWIAIFGYGLALVGRAVGVQDPKTGPAIDSVIGIILLTMLTGVFGGQLRRPTKTVWRLTAVAYVVAAVILGGRLTGWIPAP